jgi:hypothetical protein
MGASRPPLCTLFCAGALPSIEAALHHPESAHRSVLETEMKKAGTMGVEGGQERQLGEGEIHRRNYAIAAVCIRHSHSIVPGGLLVTS